MALVKLSYVRSIPDVLTSRDIDIFVDINTHAPQHNKQLKLSPRLILWAIYVMQYSFA